MAYTTYEVVEVSDLKYSNQFGTYLASGAYFRPVKMPFGLYKKISLWDIIANRKLFVFGLCQKNE